MCCKQPFLFLFEGIDASLLLLFGIVARAAVAIAVPVAVAVAIPVAVIAVASAVAVATKAEKLIYLTDVEGVLDNDGKVIYSMTEQEAFDKIYKPLGA